jgi:DNA-binding XRE family transcriptional regulator
LHRFGGHLDPHAWKHTALCLKVNGLTFVQLSFCRGVGMGGINGRPAAAFILASIAREIVADRKSAGLTQQELAKRAGIRQETLSRIESGKHPPTMKTLKKIDRALGKDSRAVS